jgi:hypothetical protein
MALMDMSGKIAYLNDLNGYTPERVCSAADGSIWTIGQQWQEESSGQTYNLVRRYGSDGTLKGTYVPRPILPGIALNFHPRGNVFGNSVNNARLSCGTESVGVYLGAPLLVWFEISLNATTAQQWKVLPLKLVTMTGLELVSSKSVYGSFVTGPENANGAGVRQIYKLTLAGNGIATWTPIPGATSVTGGPATLVGRDGTSLVHLMGSQRPATNPVLNWSTP